MLTWKNWIMIWLLTFSAACAASLIQDMDHATAQPCHCPCEEPAK